MESINHLLRAIYSSQIELSIKPTSSPLWGGSGNPHFDIYLKREEIVKFAKCVANEHVAQTIDFLLYEYQVELHKIVDRVQNARALK